LLYVNAVGAGAAFQLLVLLVVLLMLPRRRPRREAEE